MNRVLRESRHTCTPDFKEEEISMLLDECKEIVKESAKPMPKLYEEIKKKHKIEEYVGELPNFDSVRSSLYSARNKHLNVNHASSFKTVAEVEVPEKFKSFVLFDVGTKDRIICFVTQKARDVLKRSTHFLIDGRRLKLYLHPSSSYTPFT